MRFGPYDGTPLQPDFKCCPECGRPVIPPTEPAGPAAPIPPTELARPAPIARRPERPAAPIPPTAPAEETADPFLLELAWEHASYPAGVDSLARGRLTIRGRPGVVPERSGCHLLMVLDVSGSMDQPDKYPFLRDALGLLLRNLEEGLSVTVILFSTDAELLCEALPASEARRRAEQLVAAMDQTPIRFQETHLGAGLNLAADAVDRFRAHQPGAVQRIYILTDGQLTDEVQAPAMAGLLGELGVEASSYGFGADFAFESMRIVLGRTAGGLVKPIRNTSDIAETFRRVANVTASIVASGAGLMIQYAPQLIPGDFFCHRPAARIYPRSAQADSRELPITIGNLEAQRDYVWAFEGRLPEDVAPGFRLGTLHLVFKRGGRSLRTQAWPLVPPVLEGSEEPGARDPSVADVIQLLEGLRDGSPEAQIAAYAARIAIARAEGRDPEYIRAMEEVKEALERGEARESIDPALQRAADADPRTMV